MTRRDKLIHKIRALAERPGTEGEGAAARAALARLESQTSDLIGFASFEHYLIDKDLDKFLERLRREYPVRR